MDAGRFVQFLLHREPLSKEPLSETSHHYRVPLTIRKRLFIWAVIAALAWLVLGAACGAGIMVLHMADVAVRHTAHMRAP